MGPWLIDVADRSELDLWLEGGPPYRAGTTVMLVRGDDGDVRSFLPNALDAAKEGAKRVVVWLKKSSLLSDSEQKELFGGRWQTEFRCALDHAFVVLIGPKDHSLVFSGAVALESFPYSGTVV